MIVKVQHTQGKTVVAACDTELLGRKFEENSHQLDLTSEFYQGKEVNDREAGDLIRNADHVNLVGKKAVQIGIDEDVIDEDQVKKIKDIPYAQAVIEHN